MSDKFLLPYQFVSIIGPDAEKFLQGQVSCDISTLTTREASYGTVNTPKGRMYGFFLVIRVEDGFLLRLHESTVDQFVAQLSKYKVFFKCELKVEDQWKAIGSLSNEKEMVPYQVDTTDIGRITRLPGDIACYEIWTAQEDQDCDATELSKWQCIQNLNGIPELYGTTQEQFILQYLNLQHLKAVSFNKGCYTGQEIIARMKFLGKLKKKTFLLRSNTQQTATPGETIFDSNGKKCGELVTSNWHADYGSTALGILDISYAEKSESVFLKDDLCTAFSVEEIVYN